jgi:hypothetical protein
VGARLTTASDHLVDWDGRFVNETDDQPDEEPLTKAATAALARRPPDPQHRQLISVE